MDSNTICIISTDLARAVHLFDCGIGRTLGEAKSRDAAHRAPNSHRASASTEYPTRMGHKPMTAQYKAFIELHNGCELVKDCGEYLLVRSQYTQRWGDDSVTLHYMVETIPNTRAAVRCWLGY